MGIDAAPCGRVDDLSRSFTDRRSYRRTDDAATFGDSHNLAVVCSVPSTDASANRSALSRTDCVADDRRTIGSSQQFPDR